MKERLYLILILSCFGAICGGLFALFFAIDLPPLIALCLILSVLGLFIG